MKVVDFKKPLTGYVIRQWRDREVVHVQWANGDKSYLNPSDLRERLYVPMVGRKRYRFYEE